MQPFAYGMCTRNRENFVKFGSLYLGRKFGTIENDFANWTAMENCTLIGWDIRENVLAES